MTLRQFFECWFLPILLAAEGAHASTIQIYYDALAWWERLSGDPERDLPRDPPLQRIDEYAVATFKRRMATATFRRGRLGKDYPLKPHTIAKHLKNLRAIIYRAGPTTDIKRKATGVIDEAPHIIVPAPRTKAKRPFAIEVAQALYAASWRLPMGRRRRSRATDVAPLPQVWWAAFLAVLYYTGLRVGTALKLRYDMLERRGDETWLIVPGEIVDKTSKPLDKYLHPDALALIAALRAATGAQSGDKIFAWPHHYTHLRNTHARLQRLAGCEKVLSPQAWRRTHGVEIAKLGAKLGMRIAQAALDHADERTTRESYVDLEPDLIRQLPRLGPTAPPAGAQLLLF